MRFNRLQLRNYRRFAELTLVLDERMTVVVGGNGAGKTATLEALATAGTYLLGLLGNKDGFDFAPTDVRVRDVSGPNQTAVEPVLPASLELEWGGRQLRLVYSEYPLNLEWDGARAKQGELLPILRYFGATTTPKPLMRSASAKERRRAYRWAATGVEQRVPLDEWFLLREDIRLQALSDAVEAGEDPSQVTEPELEAMNQQLRAIIDVDRVMYRKKEGKLLTRFRDEPWLPFEQQSQGRRRIVNLVANLTWMAFTLNPQLGTEAPKQTPGVVLIDEVNLHLHPKWQREILDKLCAAFPAVQFVVTTHSPQVVAGARPEWLRILDGDQVHRVEHTYGRDSGSLLEDVFGVPTYPNAVLARYHQGLALVEQSDLGGARDLALELEKQLGPSDTLVQGLYFEIDAALPVASDG